MNRYTFKNGDIITSDLDIKELIKRINRLDTLRVLTEGYDEGDGLSIYNKALKAYNKYIGFTGIIRLTRTEKDFLGYLLDSEYNDQNDIGVLEYYTK